MKKFTKALALVLTLALMIPSVAAFAAESPAKKNIKSATVTVDTKTYNGKAQAPKVTVKVGKKTLKKGVDYKVSAKKNMKDAGKYNITIKGIGNYTGSKTVKWTIKAANQSLKVTVGKKAFTKKTITKKSLKKKAQTIKLTVKGNKGKVTYKSSNAKVVKVDKNGKITVVKNAKAGTYKVTITAAAAKNYNKTTKTVKITVK